MLFFFRPSPSERWCGWSATHRNKNLKFYFLTLAVSICDPEVSLTKWINQQRLRKFPQVGEALCMCVLLCTVKFNEGLKWLWSNATHKSEWCRVLALPRLGHMVSPMLFKEQLRCELISSTEIHTHSDWSSFALFLPSSVFFVLYRHRCRVEIRDLGDLWLWGFGGRWRWFGLFFLLGCHR